MLENDVLVEIDAVKAVGGFSKAVEEGRAAKNLRNVEEEPAHASTDQKFGMLPLREVDDKFCKLN